MLRVDTLDTMHYTLNMRRGLRYIGEIDGRRHWKAIVCGHPVPNYQSKKCWNCWKPEIGKSQIGTTRVATIFGEAHHSWKGGRVLHKASGYVLVKSRTHPFKQKNGYVFEHRLVMEKHLGRYLNPEEEVHHINHVKHDNRLENLMLFSTHAEHIKYEHKNGERQRC